jgi:3-oxoacyl-[acyl-carrier protein] reductase
MAGMDLGLRERVYIVTGASRGLGRATAEVLVGEGARLVLSSRSMTSVEAAVRELGADSVTGIAADNADQETPRRLIETAIAAYGRLDGALISVGGPTVGPVMQVSDEQWQTAFDAVFLGAVRLAREVAESLAAGGSVALVLSTSVREPIPGLAVSNGLRPGLAMLAKTMADELGPRGIRVNGLLPGRVDTERVRELDAATNDAEATRRATAATIPLRRYGDPAEFGRAAAFLLSPAAGYITGTMLPVDGGLTRSL